MTDQDPAIGICTYDSCDGYKLKVRATYTKTVKRLNFGRIYDLPADDD